MIGTTSHFLMSYWNLHYSNLNLVLLILSIVKTKNRLVPFCNKLYTWKYCSALCSLFCLMQHNPIQPFFIGRFSLELNLPFWPASLGFFLVAFIFLETRHPNLDIRRLTTVKLNGKVILRSCRLPPAIIYYVANICCCGFRFFLR